MENMRIGSILLTVLVMIVAFGLVKWGLNATGRADLADKF